jgi:hypothetical protein
VTALVAITGGASGFGPYGGPQAGRLPDAANIAPYLPIELYSPADGGVRAFLSGLLDGVGSPERPLPYLGESCVSRLGGFESRRQRRRTGASFPSGH